MENKHLGQLFAFVSSLFQSPFLAYLLCFLLYFHPLFSPLPSNLFQQLQLWKRVCRHKSRGTWGVLGKPKARRRSTGLLRKAVIILVTCYRKACSSVYLQLLLPLGAPFNAWGWLLCNKFRNTGELMKERSETREARNHWPITDQVGKNRKENQGRNSGHWKSWKQRKTK